MEVMQDCAYLVRTSAVINWKKITAEGEVEDLLTCYFISLKIDDGEWIFGSSVSVQGEEMEKGFFALQLVESQLYERTMDGWIKELCYLCCAAGGLKSSTWKNR